MLSGSKWGLAFSLSFQPSKWCQRRHSEPRKGENHDGWMMTNSHCCCWWCRCLLAAESSGHWQVGRSQWELAAFLEQWLMSRAWFVPRLNAVSCSQHRWLERKPELWKQTQGIYLGALWVTSWWNKLSVPIARLQPCYHSGSGFSANIHGKNIFKGIEIVCGAVDTLLLSGQMNLLT